MGFDFAEYGAELDREIHNFQGYNDCVKPLIQRRANAFLFNIADEVLNLNRSQYDLRRNMAGTAVLGEITLHTDRWFIQISKYDLGDSTVLFRTCKGRTDFTGGRNQWTTCSSLATVLANEEKMIQKRDPQLPLWA